MRLDEEVLMDFFREYISVTVSVNPFSFAYSHYYLIYNPYDLLAYFYVS